MSMVFVSSTPNFHWEKIKESNVHFFWGKIKRCGWILLMSHGSTISCFIEKDAGASCCEIELLSPPTNEGCGFVTKIN